MKDRIPGARVLVAGMARSGLAAVELLRGKGARVAAADAKPLSQLPDAGAKLEQWNVAFFREEEADFAAFDLVVLSPGVPFGAPPVLRARRAGVPVIGEVELAGYYLQGPILGITGANGKTTTTALAGHILRECGIPVQVGGNIGTPPTAMVAGSRPGQWNVLELSSFQLETTAGFHARIGVALNVTPDHLDRHGSFEAYAQAKGRLFELQQEGDFAVLNAADPVCAGYARLTPGQTVWFSSKAAAGRGAWLECGRILFDGEALMDACEVPLRGLHNLENVMAAAAAARLAGAPLDGIAAAVRTFPGVEHRLEFVRTVRGVSFYNDSKATNVDATLKALDAFQGGVWIILGGKDKGSDYTPLRAPLQAKTKAVLLVGAAAEKIAGQVEGAAPLVRAGTLDRAVELAFAGAAAGDTVLLAPACASFDQFTSYEHRGRVFKDLVAALTGEDR
jgi:UDP-N-acetylmuramoylalanine--D-glutamate ligase